MQTKTIESRVDRIETELARMKAEEALNAENAPAMWCMVLCGGLLAILALGNMLASAHPN
jgi:hypothetical protein